MKFLLHNLTPHDYTKDEVIESIVKYPGVSIETKFPVYEVVDESGKIYGYLIWNEIKDKLPFEETTYG